MRAYTLLPLVLMIAACAGEVDPSTESTEQPQVTESAACDAMGETQACETDTGEVGRSECQWDAERRGLYFTACGDTTVCSPDEPQTCGECTFRDGAWVVDGGCGTPLVLSFDSAPVEFTQPSGAFDVMGVGMSLGNDWVSAATPWLVLDRNGNGTVDDGSELFGSMTRLGSGERAPHGFAALAELDQNGDAAVTPSDASFTELLLWRDVDQNRQSTPNELAPLADSGVRELSLRYTRAPRCTATSCEVERAGFQFFDDLGREQRGTLIDVHFQTY